jgi:hypothetical protein
MNRNVIRLETPQHKDGPMGLRKNTTAATTILVGSRERPAAIHNLQSAIRNRKP